MPHLYVDDVLTDTMQLIDVLVDTIILYRIRDIRRGRRNGKYVRISSRLFVQLSRRRTNESAFAELNIRYATKQLN